MKKTFFILPLLALILVAATSCNKDEENVWDTYSEWRTTNETFFDEQKYAINENGNAEYEALTAQWNSSATILLRWLSDRAKTEGNLSPLYNSTVAVKYIGRLYDGTPVDSSYLQTDSLFYTRPTDLVQGWQIALLNMRVGDSCRIVIPYTLGYGATKTGAILPYSTLIFDLKLADIVKYETRP